MTIVPIKKLYEDSQTPAYATKGSCGADLFAYFPNQGADYLLSGEWMLFKTGVAVHLPDDMEATIRSRSGMALKYGIAVLNSPGTIDSDYRGEIGVILINQGNKDVLISHGDRIAQIVFSPVLKVDFQEVDELAATERASGGYGSTGV